MSFVDPIYLVLVVVFLGMVFGVYKYSQTREHPIEKKLRPEVRSYKYPVIELIRKSLLISDCKRQTTRAKYGQCPVLVKYSKIIQPGRMPPFRNSRNYPSYLNGRKKRRGLIQDAVGILRE